MNYSVTYLGLIVTAVGWLLSQAGISYAPAEVENAVNAVVQIVGWGIAIWGRYRIGGVSILGAKK